jgi:hypothetical protein
MIDKLISVFKFHNKTQFKLPKKRGKNVKDRNSIKVNPNKEYNKF